MHEDGDTEWLSNSQWTECPALGSLNSKYRKYFFREERRNHADRLLPPKAFEEALQRVFRLVQGQRMHNAAVDLLPYLENPNIEVPGRDQRMNTMQILHRVARDATGMMKVGRWPPERVEQQFLGPLEQIIRETDTIHAILALEARREEVQPSFARPVPLNTDDPLAPENIPSLCNYAVDHFFREHSTDQTNNAYMLTRFYHNLCYSFENNGTVLTDEPSEEALTSALQAIQRAVTMGPRLSPQRLQERLTRVAIQLRENSERLENPVSILRLATAAVDRRLAQPDLMESDVYSERLHLTEHLRPALQFLTSLLDTLQTMIARSEQQPPQL
jgi:hypothetical protein